MANCCSFEVSIRAQTVEDADRFVAVLQNRDPEFCIVRSWPDQVIESDGKGTPERTVWGMCPWSGDYMWRPEETIYGRNVIPGETVFDDGRKPVSIPYLCKVWGMTAEGWDEEPCCDVDGEYECGTDGVLTYRDMFEAEDDDEDEEE